MEKQEFIDGLRSSLNGRIAPSQVEDTIDYYRDYINVEVRKGKTEQSVLEMLGDPRLIARTIIQTSEQTNVADREPEEMAQPGEGFGVPIIRRIFRLPGWLIAVVILLLLIVVFGIIFSILSALAPVLIVLGVVALVIKIFRDRLN